MKMSTLAASLISAGLATLITARVVENTLIAEFDEQMQRELDASVSYLEQTGQAEATEEYEEQRVTSVDISKPTPDHVVDKGNKIRYDNVIKQMSYASTDDTSDEALQEALDEPDIPDLHTITMEEFMREESEYPQMTLNYFADDVVLDENYEHVVDAGDLIGNTRPPFGMDSPDEHIVYLRNNKLRREFEVVFDADTNGADILADPTSDLEP